MGSDSSTSIEIIFPAAKLQSTQGHGSCPYVLTTMENEGFGYGQLRAGAPFSFEPACHAWFTGTKSGVVSQAGSAIGQHPIVVSLVSPAQPDYRSYLTSFRTRCASAQMPASRLCLLARSFYIELLKNV